MTIFQTTCSPIESIEILLKNVEIQSFNTIDYHYQINSNQHVFSMDYNGNDFDCQILKSNFILQKSGLNYIATVISSNLTLSHLQKLFTLLPQITSIKTLSHDSTTVLEIHLKLNADDVQMKMDELFHFGQESHVDVALQLDTIFRRQKRLVVFDMDSTLIYQECIDELAREAGVYNEIAPITESAMRGEIDFNQSLRKRVGLLKGQSVDLIETVKNRITFTKGAKELCKVLKRLGYKLAVLSGGFIPMANLVKNTLDLDYAFANVLEISKDGKTLTGNVVGEIVNGERKAELLSVIAQAEKIESNQIFAIGDGANDLLMMRAAGCGIAFNAKPKVQQQASIRLNQPSLINVLYFLGYSSTEINQLLQ